MSKIFLRHTLIKKTFLTFLFLTTYLYTFLLYENPSFIIFSAENIFDIHFTEFGAVMTTVLPVLFKYCYKYCYSDSRKLCAVMKGEGLAL
jgi:hypothetical protein